MTGMEKLGGDSPVEPDALLTWILREDFHTSEDAVRRVFGQWVGGRPEGVEFTDLDGVRQTIVIPPSEASPAGEG